MKKLTNDHLSYIIGAMLTVTLLFLGNYSSHGSEASKLFEGFQNPPADARPFVRWWWNGNKVAHDEIDRELGILKAAGFGGVEINPIAFPDGAEDVGVESLTWMSDDWIDVFVHACQQTKQHGMIADAIVGSGWPFGGEFLNEDETCQRVVSHTVRYQGEDTIHFDSREAEQRLHHRGKRVKNELMFLALIPESIENLEQSIDLMGQIDENGLLSYPINAGGTYLLSYGFRQQGHRQVMHGAKGAAGPVMDHYKKDVTMRYLSRLKRISEKKGIELEALLRALFCDSIELAGANWTDGFVKLFLERYGYKLEPWVPFVFYSEKMGYEELSFSEDFRKKLKRVRYDYNALLVHHFLEKFTQTFQNFCTENGLKCRYQAYGTPYLMGMLDGYMIPDIPESNNWIYSADMKSDSWEWNQGHGYMIWNMYAAAGGHLTGKKIISCETMTNTKGVFRTTLEEIKQHDDMNFITGINHSVLHGFNYSPPEAGFPGWIRYGAYFSEQNTWWPHLHHWVDYNARLSYVFQHSQPQKSIAIVGPTSDLWGDKGLSRGFFHESPWYLYRMWEPISNLGYSCEYINENVLKNANVSAGTIQYGPMEYKMLVLTQVESMHPETAKAIATYVEKGGKLVVLDSVPDQSLHFQNADANDLTVKRVFETLKENYPQNVIFRQGPSDEKALISWTKTLVKDANHPADVIIDKPCENVFQIHQSTENKEIYFFTNVQRNESVAFEAKFPVKGKYPYVWNPETGERTPLNYQNDPSKLCVILGPIESLLIVFEEHEPTGKTAAKSGGFAKVESLRQPWKVEARHVNGQINEWDMDRLEDISLSQDPFKHSFAGVLVYKTTFSSRNGITHLNLGDTNEGVTEVYVNGQKAGTKWYGEAIFDVSDLVKEGENDLEIHCTTVLANYCRSLTDNITTKRWTKGYSNSSKTPTGIEGPVCLLRSEK